MTEVHNPSIPYNGPIQGGMFPGRIVRVLGTAPGNSHKFAVNFLCAATGDIALHLSPHFQSHHVVRNSVQHMNWGHEEKHGGLPIHPGQPFEIIILCDPTCYKIAFNGVHFAEFHHRLPYQSVSNIAIDGQVLVTRVSFEGGTTSVGGFAPPPQHMGHPPHTPAAPYPVGAPHIPHASGPYTVPSYPTQPGMTGAPHIPQQPSLSHYPHQPGVHGAAYPTQPGVHGAAYPAQPGVHGAAYPAQPGVHGAAYPAQPGVHGTAYPTQPGYPTHMTSNSGYPHSPTGHKKTGFLDKAGMAVAGALGASALMGGGHKYNKLGGLGGGLGTTLAGAAMTGHLNPKKALKKQSKAQKKALKYGLPIAGVGLGAYALHKGVHKMGHHHHHRSSSSSSSSSSD